ncbi:MAG: DUF2063 domain-containing protein [Burkholderiaceae bacterium]|nr:MAG: DUF2063 domain-containing protein [Burkholderiaceae bacterium]
MSKKNALTQQQQHFRHAVIAESDAVEIPPAELFHSRADGNPALLHIYRQAYRARLCEALQSNYPILYRLLGDELFEQLAQNYIAEHPSRQSSIRWFGHQLADFLQQRPDPHSDLLSHPALCDLARMEWAIGGSFDAANAPFLTIDALLVLPAEAWAALRCQPQAAVQLVPLEWEVEATWKALNIETEETEEQTPEPTQRAHTLLVWRAGKNGLETLWRSLEADEAVYLKAFLSGISFAQLCELIADQNSTAQAAQTAASLLHRWVQDGLFRV